MPVRHASLLWILVGLVVAPAAWRQAVPARTGSAPGPREQVALFSACSQAPEAARSVERQANDWLSDHRAVRVLQREMYAAPCPGATEFGSIAVTLAIHYEP